MNIAQEILHTHRTIVVVGLSSDTSRPSYRVSRYMQEHGYRLIPVNPSEREVLGEVYYPDIGSIPEPVEFVNVFRRPEFCADIARAAAAAGAHALWLQLGIVSSEARRIAEQAGMRYVEDACVMVVHQSGGLGSQDSNLD